MKIWQGILCALIALAVMAEGFLIASALTKVLVFLVVVCVLAM